MKRFNYYKFLEGPHFLSCIISWLFSAGFCLEWMSSVEADWIQNIERIFLLVLLFLTPINTRVFGVIIIVSCFFISFIPPLAVVGIYWLMSYPFYAACILLGVSIGKLWFAAVLVSIAFVGGVGSVIYNNDTIRTLFYVIQPSSIAWFVGSLIHFSIAQMREKVLLENENIKSKERLYLMRILHDDIANDLTCVSITLQNNIRHNKASSVVEQVCLQDSINDILLDLRSSVIRPLQNNTSFFQRGMQSLSSVKLEEVVHYCNDRLHKFGFIGSITYCKDILRYSTHMIVILNDCISEISANIIKHAEVGIFVFMITIENDEIKIISSNKCKKSDLAYNASNNFGLDLLRSEIAPYKGELYYSREDDEWFIKILLPISEMEQL